MSPFCRVAIVWILCSMFGSLCAQHCPPLYECYLNSTSVKKLDGVLKFRSEMTIEGGRGQAAFQAYLIAYLERDHARVPARLPKDVIDPEVALVVQTKLIKRNKERVFPIEFSIAQAELAKKVIAHRKLTEKDRTAHGGWGVYKDRIRVAVFVPLLDDKLWSVIEGLPEDRHFCNYTHERAMLFQTLPYRLSMRFGVVRARQLAEGTVRMQINGDRPSTESPPEKGDRKEQKPDKSKATKESGKRE